MRSLLARRDKPTIVGLQIAGALVLFAVLVLGGLAYASGGPPTRDLLVTQMMINAVIVLGMQVYIGNTGVLSFGHVGFGAIAGYTFALMAVSPERKQRIIPDAPFGVVDDGVGLAARIGNEIGRDREPGPEHLVVGGHRRQCSDLTAESGCLVVGAICPGLHGTTTLPVR